MHLATGDMFRENLREETELGLLAKTHMDKGDLVPDDVTIRMLLDRLDRPDAATGTMLDGFPRTAGQAEALDAALSERDQQVDCVLLIDVSCAEVKSRLGGRWTCPDDGAIYHEVNKPPKNDMRCDNCDTPLIQRDDDQPEAIANRLKVYEEQTAPLIGYYEEAGKLVHIDGQRSPEAVGEDLLNTVKGV